MIGYDELARAASEGDTLAETRGFPEAMGAVDLEVEGVMRAADQRAIRCALAVTGDERTEQVAEAARAGRPLALALTEEQKILLPVARLGFIDGVAVGARAMMDAP